MATSRIALNDVQGIAFYGYSEHKYARYLLVTLAYDDPRTFAWLAGLEVHHARDAHNGGQRRTSPSAVQVAFTARGLTAFGLSPDDLDEFPREFLQGMGDPTHARIMGDAPEGWTFGAPGQPALHAVLMLYARTEADLRALADQHRAALAKAGATIAHEDEGRILTESREHFGFHDGISEPHVDGGPRTKKTATDAMPSIPAGELLLGYEDAYEQTTAPPTVQGFDFGRNGSFLVYRTLSQDVAGFWAAMRKHARPRDGESVEVASIRLAAAMVGRWPGGAPLVKYPNGDPGLTSDNDFLYAAPDPNGYKCPFGAHARRANPRDMLPPSPQESMVETTRHRLVRRGRPYGPEHREPWKTPPPAGVDRGLVFIALCASLRRQFEFIQQSWVNNPKFAGLYDERDPMLGTAPGSFTLQGDPVRRHLTGLPSFVTMRGGGYFFLPGMRALAWLATPRGAGARGTA
jgi:Dyp-type peroxidase family